MKKTKNRDANRTKQVCRPSITAYTHVRDVPMTSVGWSPASNRWIR